jgi:hypothetical protein
MYLEQLTHVTWHSSWCIMLFRPVYAMSWSLEGRKFLISAVFSWAELVEFEIMSLLKEFNVNFLDKLRVFVLGSYYYRSWIISRQLILQYAIHWYVIILHRNQWWGTHFTQESMMRYTFYTGINDEVHILHNNRRWSFLSVTTYLEQSGILRVMYIYTKEKVKHPHVFLKWQMIRQVSRDYWPDNLKNAMVTC